MNHTCTCVLIYLVGLACSSCASQERPSETAAIESRKGDHHEPTAGAMPQAKGAASQAEKVQRDVSPPGASEEPIVEPSESAPEDSGPGSDSTETLADRASSLSDSESRQQLIAASIGFTEALSPEHLSCQGAVRYRDAICEIADRLCQDENEPTLSREKDCQKARESCESVQKEYREPGSASAR